MRKTVLIFLTVLFLAPMISGCYYHPYPYRDGHGRGYYGDRTYDRDRDGYRDYRERR